jgi:predicted PurR-regulated permease PerM
VSGYTDRPQKLLGPAATIGAGVAGILTTLIVIAITAVYTAVRPQPLQDGVLRLIVPERREQARTIMHRLAQSYLGWLRGLGAGMVVLWIVTYTGLRLVSLPFALVFATLTAVAMVVPYYGALVSSIPPILLALTISPAKALIVAAIYLVAHQIEGHLIEPLVMARAVKLHPAMVAVGVIAAERLFGPIGLVVAVPLLVTAKVLVEELWIASIDARAPMGSRPPDAPDAIPDGDAARRFERIT